jgi:hypothetical protein
MSIHETLKQPKLVLLNLSFVDPYRTSADHLHYNLYLGGQNPIDTQYRSSYTCGVKKQ